MDDAREPRDRHGPVTLYTASDCDVSPKVRAWLTEHVVPFAERNVTGDVDAAMSLYRTGTFATPLLVVGDRSVLGFRPDEIAAALADEGVPAPAPPSPADA